MEFSSTQSVPAVPVPPASGAARDHELLRFVARCGVVSIDHVRAFLGVGRTAAYRRVAYLLEAGLLQRFGLLRDEPSLLCATRVGLRRSGTGLSPVVVSPGSVEHWLRCTSTALLLAERHGHQRVLTEREIALWERVEERPLASARVGVTPDGRRRLHRPDLAILLPKDSAGLGNARHSRTRERPSEIASDLQREEAGAEEMRLISVEVELTPKSPRRLEQIVRAWRHASWVGEVHYHCAPGATRRALERAVAKTHSGDRVHVFDALPR
jgi:hypothetical protein